ncbi:MAG: DUF3244 domain-containing protein [Prevotella sp.]|jgi:hypothetical protein|nr:DUF3244 domain-containing protein [Prevotella sp.]
MKKVLVALFALSIVLLYAVGINSKSQESSKLQELLEILAPQDKLNEYDIIHGTAGSKPTYKSKSRSLFKAIQGFVGESTMVVVFNVEDVFEVEIVDETTGAVVYSGVVNSATTNEITIDITGWDSGDYTIYITKDNPENEDDYYYGEFSIE